MGNLLRGWNFYIGFGVRKRISMEKLVARLLGKEAQDKLPTKKKAKQAA